MTTRDQDPSGTQAGARPVRGESLRHALRELAERYGLLALYAFGSRAGEVRDRLSGPPAEVGEGRAGSPEGRTGPPASDLDVGVEPLRDRVLDARDRVRLAADLETLFGVARVDLIVLPEAGSFLAADVVRGELLYAADLDAEAQVQLYYLARAADLAPYLREQWRELVGGGS